MTNSLAVTDRASVWHGLALGAFGAYRGGWKHAAMIRIGPAGWSYKDWEGIVYPASKPKGFHPASYLAQYFDTIEVAAITLITTRPSGSPAEATEDAAAGLLRVPTLAMRLGARKSLLMSYRQLTSPLRHDRRVYLRMPQPNSM